MLPRVGENLRPLLAELLDDVDAIVSRPAAEWDDNDLASFTELFTLLQPGEAGMGEPLPAALAEALAAILGAAARLPGGDEANVPVTTDMKGDLERAVAEAGRLMRDETIPAEGRHAAGRLARTLSISDAKKRLDLRTLAPREQAVRAAVGGVYSGGVRTVMLLIGRRADVAPPGAAFVDSLAPWAPRMVVIPAPADGSFLMGTPTGQPGREDYETQHEVTLAQNFALADAPLTFEAYDAYCDLTDARRPEAQGWGRKQRPVINLDWTEADAYCQWLTEMTGARYRLPSEAQWEYACRGDRTGRNETPFCPEVALSGAGAYISADEANFDGTITFNGSGAGDYRKQTVPVDEPGFGGNRFGLRHMHGNVWEWCADVFEQDYALTPADGSPHLPKKGGVPRRVVRGGSWSYYPQSLRSAARGRVEPGDRYDYLGFRPARTPLTP